MNDPGYGTAAEPTSPSSRAAPSDATATSTGEREPPSEAEGGPWTPAALARLRRDPRRSAVALIAAAAVGLALAWVHWLGLVAAGALLGLASESLPRAVYAGVAFGVLVLVVNVLAHPTMELGEFAALTPPAYVAVAAALALPVWGSLVRGVI